MHGAIEESPSLPCTPGELSGIAWSIYRDARFTKRLLMYLRPKISPFDRLVDFVPENSSILDVGCGCGLLLGLLAGLGRRFEGTGIDSSAGAITAAQAMAHRIDAAHSPAKLHFQRLNVQEPWPQGPFDVVSIIDVMHHVPLSARRSVLELANRSLRPGGILIYKDIGERPRWRAAANRLHDLIMAREWVHYTPLAQAVAWAEELGLTPLSSDRINRKWYGHELVVFRKPD